MTPSIYASIITIGDELLIGQTIDTNSAFIAQELNKIGVWVRRRVAVGDVYDDIWQALDEERKVSQIIIITGGLGPTADDITKPLLCKYFGGKLVVNQEVLNHVKYLFENVYRRPGPMLESNLRQAEVPDVATVLHNSRGTAPGMWFAPLDRRRLAEGDALPPEGGGDSDKRIFISLPGVPHEMKGLMIEEVIPKLLQEFTMPVILHRTVFTSGQGESMLAESIKNFETALPAYIKLAYLPGYGMVRLRLTASGNAREELETAINNQFEQLKVLVKDYLVTDKDDGMEVVIGNLLKERNKTMGTAESCTGGYIAHLITSVAGSSTYYKGSIVSYANEIKENLLEVNNTTLKNTGAVSEETVKEMVKGAVKKLNVDFAIATSGIMGPDGGSTEKPVGTVWIAAGTKDAVVTKQLHLRFDRERNIRQTAHMALDFLRKFILTNDKV
jgi:nicotinamide-nucleotide amidase